MRTIFTFLNHLRGLIGNLQSSDVSHDRRLTVGSPSGLDANWKQNPSMRFAIVFALVFVIGVGNAWGAEEIAYTLTCPKNSSGTNYAENYDITVSSIGWNAPGNQYENGQWRIGVSKKTTAGSGTRRIYSKTAITQNITKVILTHGAKTSNMNTPTVTLNVYSTAAKAESGGTGDISSVSVTYVDNGTMTFNRPTGHDWTGRFYRIDYSISWTYSSSANYILLSSVVFKYESGTSVSLEKAATTNGSFTLSSDGPLNTTSEAQTITVTGTPNPGYYLSGVTQSGASSTLTITKTSATTYTITYPQGCTGTSTITATFAESTWKFKYSGDSYTGHPMSESDGVASYSISLGADSRFNFCIDDNGTAYKNNGTIITTTSGWVFNTTDGNCNIHTGPAGTYTFAINTTSKAVTVTYPDVTHPNEHYVYFKNSDVWGTVYGYLGNTGNSNKAAEWPGSVMQPTTTICGETYHYAALNAMSGTYNVIKFNNGGSGYGNETSNLSTDGLGKYNANRDANWHDFMYSITFVDNGKTGGSMTNVSNICAGSNVTLAANGFTKTYFSFTGWKANVDVKIGGSTVTAGTLIADASTIQDIQSNITLTAQWADVPVTSVTLDKTTLTKYVGEANVTLTATIAPATANPAVTWSSSDETVASVTSAGVVSFLKAGTATITATSTVTGSQKATCTVTVRSVSGPTMEDEDGASISGDGLSATWTVGTRALSASEGTSLYKFKEWVVTNATPANAGNMSTTLGDPTGNVTVKAVFYKPRTVTWLKGGTTYGTGSPTTSVKRGTTWGSLTAPTDPDDDALGICADKFMGWSNLNDELTGLGNSAPATLLKKADFTGNTTVINDDITFRAVFATASSGGTSASSITSYEDGTYYMIDSHTYNDVTTYYSPTGTNSGTISSVELTSIVSVTSGVLTLDLTSNLLTNAMKYTITEVDEDVYTIYNESTEEYIGANTSTSFTKTNNNKWELITSNKRFMFWYDQTTDRAVLYQHSYNSSGTQTYGKRFGCYAKNNAGKTNLNYDKEQYGSGYFFLVPANSTTYSDYVTQCVACAADPTEGSAALEGGFSLSSVGVTATGWTAGTNCAWEDYGFVWGTSADPTVSDNKVQVGNSGTATTWDGTLTGAFTTGTTYHFRAYGKNGKTGAEYQYSDDVTFTPRSVTFNLNGHGESAPSVQIVNNGGKASDPSYSEVVAGWTFGGWYDNSSCTGDAWVFGTNTVSGNNVILYAKWTEKPKYTVTLDAGNGTIGTAGWTNTSGSVYTKTQDNGDASITLPTPTCNCSGWVFQGWSLTSKDNAGSFTPDKEDGASFTPASDVTYFAVYRQSSTGGTTYSKITSAGDLTTGNYVITGMYSGTTPYKMDGSLYNEGVSLGESSASVTDGSLTESTASYVWTIIKFGSSVVFRNTSTSKFLAIVDGKFALQDEGQLFTYSVTSGAWTFTSPSGKQIIYASRYNVGDSQNREIHLYKQGSTPSGNFYTNPTCSDLSIMGVAAPAAGGSVTLSATSAKSGEKVYAYYTADDDYNFTSWSISGTGSTLSSTSAQFTEITVGTANTTVTANFAAKDWKTVTWKANGDALTGGDLGSASVKVENGHDITAMPPTPSSCDGTSTNFIGWVAESDIWSGKTDDVSGVTIYEKIADFPTVTDNVVYHAVWAHQIGTPIAEIEDNSFTSKDEDGTYCSAPFSLNAAGKYLQKQSIWTSSQMQNVTVKIRVFHVANNTAATLHVSLINSDGDEVVGSDLTAGVTGNNISNGGYTDWVELIPTSAVTGYKVSMKTPAKFGTAISKVAREVVGSGAEAYLVKCCDAPGLGFETYEQEVIREDLKGVKSTHKVIELPYTTSSGGTVTAEVKRMSTYGSRDESAAGFGCTTYTTITPDAENNKVVLEVWSVNDPVTSGQWTYRVKVMQAATDALAGNYCAAEDYCFVDVVLRDKFVDQVNGNATINKDGKGTTLNTPTEGDMDVDKNDDCHSATRRLLGWIKETDLQTIYGTPRETGALDDASAYEANKSMVVAPGNSFTTSGVTWYAVWGIDNTPEP